MTTREQIAAAIHDGPGAQAQYAEHGIPPHPFGTCAYREQYLLDADAVLALLVAEPTTAARAECGCDLSVGPNALHIVDDHDGAAGRAETTTATVADEWEPTGWWRAVGPDGGLWAEASSEGEVRGLARPGDQIERLWAARRTEWREADRTGAL